MYTTATVFKPAGCCVFPWGDKSRPWLESSLHQTHLVPFSLISVVHHLLQPLLAMHGERRDFQPVSDTLSHWDRDQCDPSLLSPAGLGLHLA